MERYWQREASLEEKTQLRTFFVEGGIPGHSLRYRDLFVCQQLRREERLGIDFDARVLAEIEAPVVRARCTALTARFMPLSKAAATMAVMLSSGNAMRHPFFSDIKEVAAADITGKQVSALSVVLSGDMVVTHEKQVMDSLHRVNKEKGIKE